MENNTDSALGWVEQRIQKWKTWPTQLLRTPRTPHVILGHLLDPDQLREKMKKTKAQRETSNPVIHFMIFFSFRISILYGF
jgi:hypothetical protein